jgi:hypothetical protein
MVAGKVNKVVKPLYEKGWNFIRQSVLRDYLIHH